MNKTGKHFQEMEEHEYNFLHDRRGTAIIINNVDFDKAPKREGSDVDMFMLYDAFSKLGFHCSDIIMYRNLKAREMELCLERKSKRCNTFCCLCMSRNVRRIHFYCSQWNFSEVQRMHADL